MHAKAPRVGACKLPLKLPQLEGYPEKKLLINWNGRDRLVNSELLVRLATNLSMACGPFVRKYTIFILYTTVDSQQQSTESAMRA